MARRSLLIVAFALVVAGCGAQAAKTAAPTTTAIVQLHQFEIIFPEGYTRLQMGAEVKLIAAKADREHHGRVRLARAAYLAASKQAVVPCFGKAKQKNLEGFLFPAGYDFDVKTTSAILVGDQIAAFCANWAKLDLSYARSKNLTAYDVLKIASMVEEEAAVPGDRAKVAAVIYNRLRLGMQLGIDATLRYGLHIPPTQSITEAELASNNPYNMRKFYGLPPTPIGNPGLASIRAAAHPSKAGYLYYARIPGTNRSAFFESYTAYESFLATHGVRTASVTVHVALLGHPVAHSLSPRMQNAAFAATRLDWHYEARDVEDIVAAVVQLREEGFAGANVTIPHKRAAAAICDEAESEAVNTLVFRDGRVLGFNTDKEVLAGIDARSACVIGAGGAALALMPALPAATRLYSRSGAWPPDAEGCDLIVNATPVRDELLVQPHAGQVVVDLAYAADDPGDTALVAAARAAGCEVVDGREALVRQGAKSFELWTGIPAPVDAMRAAVRI